MGFARAVWRRHGLKRLELRIVRVVAMDTEQVLLVTIPVAGTLAMDAHLPVAELVAVALAAQTIRLGKIDQFAGDQSQLVTIIKVVAVRAPALAFGMMQDNFFMIVGQDPPFRIGLHVGMTLGAREDTH